MPPSGEVSGEADLIGSRRGHFGRTVQPDPLPIVRSPLDFKIKEQSMATKNEHSSTSEKKVEGQKGVTQEQVGSGKEHDPNNFANDPERASSAGRKGGHESHKRD
jgi:general stress protein YciG